MVILDFLMNDQNIMFGYTPTKEKLENRIYISIHFDEYLKILFLINPVLLKEYNLFIQKY